MSEGGPFTTALHHAPQSAEGIGCLAAVPPTRREGRLGRIDPTRHEASSTRRGCKTQEAEIATGRVKRAVRPRGDPISMGVLRPLSAGKERSREEKTQKHSSGLDNCGHIEGLSAQRFTGLPG